MDPKNEIQETPEEKTDAPTVLIQAALPLVDDQKEDQSGVENIIDENTPIEDNKKNVVESIEDSANENEIISNKNDFEFTAPLQKQESNDSNTELNKIISDRDSSESPSNTKKVGFLNENETFHDEFKPLLENGESSSFQQSSKKFNNRFVLSHVNEENIDEYNKNSSKPSIKYFVDEKGLIMNDKKGTSNASEKIEHAEQESSGIRFNKETKSLEISINLGNTDSQKSGSSSLLSSKSFYQALFAELIGTYLLVLYVCSFGLPVGDPKDSPPSINGAIGTGLVVASLVWGLGHVSGANLNPAVTLALLVTGEINFLKVFFYIPCQMLGSILAAITLKSLVPAHILTSQNPPSVGVTAISSEITAYQGFGVEAIITFILILTIFASIDGKRKDLGGSFPLSIGFSLVVGALFGGKFTGASMNPARSFGPALVYSDWKDHQVYWLGPICGAITAALVYKILVLKTKKSSKQKI